MKVIFYAFAALMLLAACKSDKTGNTATKTDSMTVKKDTAKTVSPTDTLKPTAADGFFDDFIYEFRERDDFQKQRIKFPLAHIVDGKDEPIALKDWKHDRLPADDNIHAMLFDDAQSMNKVKDAAITHIYIDIVKLKDSRVKQYHFTKENGCWLLSRIDEHPLSQNANCDFYAFYADFAGKPEFQQNHIENPFYFKTYDPDAMQIIEGVLDVVQWDDFKPELPTDALICTNYATSLSPSGERILLFTDSSGGMSSTLSFKKKEQTWRLVGLENL